MEESKREGRERVMEGHRDRERGSDRHSAIAAFCGPRSSVPLCSASIAHFALSPSPLVMAEPALLWSAGDIEVREDSRYEYVPTQVFNPVPDLQTLPALTRRRVQMMSATVHDNTTVGNIYVGNCVEPMDWAGGNVGYIIDASNGNYAWNAHCVRQWLFLNKSRRHEGGTWWQRMEHAVKLVLIAVLFGESILIHCRQGKHRSGAFGCFVCLSAVWMLIGRGPHGIPDPEPSCCWPRHQHCQ